MRDIESGVSRHYASYDVLSRIRAGLAEMGHDPDRVSPDVLKPVDEFHIGGAEATSALLEKLSIRPDMEVLDIGSGIGGPARMIATRYGCHMTGVDLTPHFVETARALSAMCGMAGRVRFEVGSAVALPLGEGSFDLALLLHVGMNVPDKAALLREARRVLRDGGTFAVYEVMRTGDGDLSFPVPWAETPDLSALETPETYRNVATEAGFALQAEENRREVALDFFARLQAQAASSGPAPLGLHNLMGPTVKEKVANMITAVRAGTIAPIQMVFSAAPH
ncbi:class I SAM-dependent methyltransferase [Microvirga soli]|uniref:class I SAM-dependent methyltransferase n=1 Tax=Microvirga soli TaxID=1854496 RepID=UPI00191DD374|nr:class I SAM-dependent methyltransferase [Microvirga soli]